MMLEGRAAGLCWLSPEDGGSWWTIEEVVGLWCRLFTDGGWLDRGSQ